MSTTARKKRKLSSSSGSDSDNDISVIKRLVADDINLEISLREKLASTIESRLTWALLLQDSLVEKFHVSNGDESPNFREAALEALAAIEAPFSVLFPNNLNPIQISTLESFPNGLVQPLARPRNRIHKLKDAPTLRSVRGNVKLLFVHDTSTSPPVVYKMECPDCSRGDFTNLQGLFNHCRLLHKRDYGNHDECMQKCAVVVPDEERTWVLNNGTELGNLNLPSLRRLFQIAVGEDPRPRGGVQSGVENHVPSELSLPMGGDPPGNHPARILGHHKDTPSLAPFLGKIPKTQGINVFDDVRPVDVLNDDGEPPLSTPRSTWRMPFAHRNIANPDVGDMPSSPHPEPSPVSSSAQPKDDAASAPRSRFHIVARVVVSDHSLWLPADNRTRVDAGHTHGWMLLVDSPSYSLHVTSFLAKLTVTCITNPPPSTLLTPHVITTPPFAVVSTTDRPFLARLVLEYIGSQNLPMEVEHWVELDPLRGACSVLGDEQVLDVELDRNTELLPVREDYLSPTFDRKIFRDKQSSIKILPQAAEDCLPEYVKTLKSLLPRVPMTIKDIKGHLLVQLPYKLVSSPAQFRSLNLGRRKAIEWARARALRAIYDETIRTAPQNEALTTADIFRWMVDEGLFPREANRHQDNDSQITKKGKLVQSTRPCPGSFCPHCGLDYDYHRSAVGMESEIKPSICDVATTSPVTQFPIVDLNRIFFKPPPISIHQSLLPSLSQGQASSYPGPKNLRHSARDLVITSDPALSLAIRNLVSKLKLKTFGTSNNQPLSPGERLFPLAQFGVNAVEVTNCIAPYALLSILTKAFIGVLVRGGLNAANQDIVNDGRRKMKTRLLTPSHILRGLLGQPQSRFHSSALPCFTRAGVPFTPLDQLDSGASET